MLVICLRNYCHFNLFFKPILVSPVETLGLFSFGILDIVSTLFPSAVRSQMGMITV
jgi:hypothetical protein